MGWRAALGGDGESSVSRIHGDDLLAGGGSDPCNPLPLSR